jgi:Berberine and berberine like
MIVLKRMGGATARVPAEATAFWYRQAPHSLDVHAQWAPGGGYVNFLGADQGNDRVRAAYGGNYQRLTDVKASYDPGNFFLINHNIPPAAFPPPDAPVSGRGCASAGGRGQGQLARRQCADQPLDEVRGPGRGERPCQQVVEL